MDLSIGAHSSRTRRVTAADVAAFAQVSGDTNPVHLDPAYAAETQFGRCIAHGMFSAALISAVLGNDLPGPGSLYISQTLQFKAPVYIDDEITANVEVTAYRERSRVTTLHTTCTNQNGVLVLDGEAVVIAPKAVQQ
ncbi:MAG: MaoC family dehydratase [Burkholderiales bacterium]|nr:MaoC family dehydratase [Anaerolineae bacterium]